MAKTLSILLAIFIIGAFAYFAFVDVPIPQETVTKIIVQDQYLDDAN